MNILERVTAPTPTFFKKLRNVGLALAAASTAIIGAPLPLPAILVKIAGYLAVAAGVAGAVSQAVVIDLPPDNNHDDE